MLIFFDLSCQGEQLRKLMKENDYKFADVELKVTKSSSKSSTRGKDGQWVTKLYLQTVEMWSKTLDIFN